MTRTIFYIDSPGIDSHLYKEFEGTGGEGVTLTFESMDIKWMLNREILRGQPIAVRSSAFKSCERAQTSR